MAAIANTPKIAMTRNHSSITGPKARPMFSVPKRCVANKHDENQHRHGMTKGLSASVATLTPSSALSTEIAGVMMPSP
jgi:hypothetical protein